MNTEMKTAIVFGATGLVGSHLLTLLEQDSRYSHIKVFGRSKPQFTTDKVEFFLGDLRNPERLAVQLTGDDLYICLGTTIKAAGSKPEFRRIDLDLPVKVAELAKKNGVSTIAVISSLGANAASRNFYLHTKGEMENLLIAQMFEKTVILRPSMLLGKRDEFRLGEEIGKWLFKGLAFLFQGKLRRYRAIEAADVAAVMLKVAREASNGVTIVESEAIAEH
ncbi:MAG TPA: NAD(P)H-binding protein [Williamwhitmania sp.]|nr:NAD(P)H-binding protein [Williamwhitmania sp.]